MTPRPAEEFRIALSGPVSFGLIGLLTLTFVGALLTRGNSAPWFAPAPLIVISIIAATGIGLLWTGVRQFRFRLMLDGGGVRFSPGEEIVPWGRIGSLRATRFGLGIRLLDLEGRTLGTVPRQIAEYQRALLLLSLGMERGGGRSVNSRFEGTHGALGLLGLIAGVLFLLHEFDIRNVPVLKGPPLVIVAIVFVVTIYKLVRLWRQSGSYEIEIDRAGIRFRGRGQAWEMQWVEVKSVEARLLGEGRGPVGVRVIGIDGPVRTLPLRGLELHGVLQALRAFGGLAAEALTPPVERPRKSLLKRTF